MKWSVYFALFQSHVNYACKDWDLTRYPQHKTSILQKKGPRIIIFAPFNAHATPLFKNCNNMKFVVIIVVECCIYVSNCFIMASFSIFGGTFKLASAAHSYNTRSVRNSPLFVPSYNSVRFGRKSIIHLTTRSWNHLQGKLTEYDILSLSPKSLRILLLKFFIYAYDNYW